MKNDVLDSINTTYKRLLKARDRRQWLERYEMAMTVVLIIVVGLLLLAVLLYGGEWIDLHYPNVYQHYQQIITPPP